MNSNQVVNKNSFLPVFGQLFQNRIPRISKIEEKRSTGNNPKCKYSSKIRILGHSKLHAFKNVKCLTPRARFVIEIHLDTIKLFGAQNFEICITNVRRIFLLPHQNKLEMFMLLSLNSPIFRGQTTYNHLVFVFNRKQYEKTNIPLKPIKETNPVKDHNLLSGHIYDVMATALIIASNNRLTVCFATRKAINCSYKATTGFLYLLESEFVYITNPPIFIQFEAIASVKFLRFESFETHTFDFEITEINNSQPHTFNSISKNCYERLYQFVCDNNIGIIVNLLGTNIAVNVSSACWQPKVCLTRSNYVAEKQKSIYTSESSKENNDEFFDAESDWVSSSDDCSDIDDSSYSDESSLNSDESICASFKKAKTPSISTAYLIWLDETVNRMKKSKEDITYTEISNSLDQLWKKENKSTYEMKAFVDQRQYKSQKNILKSIENSGPCQKWKRIMRFRDDSDLDSDDTANSDNNSDDYTKNNKKQRRIY